MLFSLARAKLFLHELIDQFGVDFQKRKKNISGHCQLEVFLVLYAHKLTNSQLLCNLHTTCFVQMILFDNATRIPPKTETQFTYLPEEDCHKNLAHHSTRFLDRKVCS